MEKKTAAIVATVFTALCCGLPGLTSMCIGVLAAISTQYQDVMTEIASTPEEVLTGAAIFFCFGILLVVIPVVVGVVTLRRKNKPVIGPDEPIPPTF